MKKFLSVFISITIIMSCLYLGGFAEAAQAEAFYIDSLEQYCVYEGEIANDGYIGIPVGVKTYVKDKTATTTGTPYILYVVNTAVEKISNASNEEIIGDFLERGYLVTVLDYYNNPKTVSPQLDWSVQEIKVAMKNNSTYKSTYTQSIPFSTIYTYNLPEGYTLDRQIEYWAIDKHGRDGDLDWIMTSWNTDFLGVKGNSKITFAKDTKIIKGTGESEYLSFSAGDSMTVKEYTAMLTGGKVSDITQCIKPDGTPIKLSLCMDIIYPAKSTKKVPVLLKASSHEDNMGAWKNAGRPHVSGFLHRGYAAVLFDYSFVPMAREDHYNYYDGNTSSTSVTGDNYTYSVGFYSGVLSDTAATRRVRYLADLYPEKYSFDLDSFAAMGASKSGLVIRLGHPEPETLPEMRVHEGKNGKTRYENGDTEDKYGADGELLINGGEPQPWLTYSDGSEIPSNIQFSSTNVGAGEYAITEGFSPMYMCGTMLDGGSMWGYYANVLSNSYSNDVPLMYYTCPNIGHTFGSGPDGETGNDTYEALLESADYWLNGGQARCEYIKPLNGASKVSATQPVNVKFNGPVSEEEIAKIKITDAATGEYVDGVWEDSFGDTEWTFTPRGLKGGHTYTVYVPANITAKNGNVIKKAKSSSFTVEPEKLAAATKIGENLAATSESGVYFEVDNAGSLNTFSTKLRFGVENDAANNVLVYSADENGEAAELLGKVNLDGAGEYDLDVTDYVKNLSDGEKAAFVLKAEKQSGTTELVNIDYEGITTLPSTMSTGAVYELSDNVNSTDGGQTSFKMADVNANTAYGKYFTYWDGFCRLATLSPISTVTDSDYGRKFNVSFKIYDTAGRAVTVRIGKTAQKPVIDHTAVWRSYKTEKDAWKEYSFDYRITGSLFNYNRNKIVVRAQCFGSESGVAPLYLDDVLITETVTDVEISPEPALVFHPADEQSVSILNAGYVENGDSLDTSFEEEDTLLVSGRSRAMAYDGNKKVYAKTDLSGYNIASNAVVPIEVTNDSEGVISVYGIEGEADLDTLNYINAPANDRYSSGVDLSRVYENSALDTVQISGNGTYNFDITDYARDMVDMGKDSGYLIFVSETGSSNLIVEENFDDGACSFSTQKGGGPTEAKISDEASYAEGGKSFKLRGVQTYNRVKMDIINTASLTTADIGRSFEVTYKAKANATGSFFNSLLIAAGDNDHYQRKAQTINAADTWQSFTYNFTLTEDLITESSTAATIPSWFNFQLDSLVKTAGTSDTTLYIDDIVVKETGLGDIVFDFSEKVVINNAYTKTFSFEDCTGWTVKGSADEVDSSYDMSFSGCNSNDSATISTDENHTAGGTKSLKFVTTANCNRFKFANIFADNLTEADLGKTFNISFYAKATNSGTINMGMMSYRVRTYDGVNVGYDGVNVGYESNGKYMPQSANITTEWQKFSYDITVSEKMLASTFADRPDTGLHAAWFAFTASLSQSTASPQSVYIDDLVVLETTPAEDEGDAEETVDSYYYKADMESGTTGYAASSNTDNDGPAMEGVVAKYNGFSILKEGDTTAINMSAAENRTTGGSKSLYIQSTQNYNRVYFYNIADELVEGEKFKVSFWMKADSAGKFSLSMSRLSSGGGESNKVYYTISADDVGVWKKYVYEFTVDSTMVSDNRGLLKFVPSSFGQKSDDSVRVKFYIDDLSSYQIIEGNNQAIPVEKAKTICTHMLEDDTIPNVMGASSDIIAGGIHKAYISFEGNEKYKNTYSAKLNIDVAEANGQTLKVYGLINSAYPGELTYNSAPASKEDESMNESYAYGSAPLKVLENVKPGIYSIDVTDYVKENAPKDALFAIVSEDIGGTQYITLDFETFKMTNGVDYIAESDITVTDGKAKVAGTKIQLMNIFGNSNAAVKAGEVYEISFDITADSDSNIIAGAAKADGEMVGDVASISALAGAEQSVKFSYTATEEDEAAGVCSVVIESSAAGFAIDNLKAKSTTAVVINKNAELMAEIAKDTEIGDFDEVTINVTVVGGDNVSINGEDKGDTTTSTTYRGNVLDMVADGDGVFMYWIDADSNTILSYDETFSYTVGSDRSLAAVYADKADVFVSFTSMANKVVASGIASSITVPADPYVYGYQFNGWYIGAEKQSIVAGDSITTEENTEYKAGFVKDNASYSVNVNGEVGQYTYNEKVTLTAEAENFSYWKRDGVIVSYNTEYSFYVNGDTTVEAVYGESVSGGVVLAMANPVLVDGGKIAFFAERDIPAEYTLIETGILIGYSAGVNIDNAPVKAIAKSTANKGQYTIRKTNLADGSIYYGVAYAIYRDANGTLNTAYSNEVSYEYKITE